MRAVIVPWVINSIMMDNATKKRNKSQQILHLQVNLKRLVFHRLGRICQKASVATEEANSEHEYKNLQKWTIASFSADTSLSTCTISFRWVTFNCTAIHCWKTFSWAGHWVTASASPSLSWFFSSSRAIFSAFPRPESFVLSFSRNASE